ncbi:hypothetical protein L7F22_006082 [Adiantum nelumboides]|nr:hypothetical protein [Adiantum nelumboides]
MFMSVKGDAQRAAEQKDMAPQSSRHKMDARGLPVVALPWIELGRLRERARWQATGIALLERAVRNEIGVLIRETKYSLIPTPTLEARLSTRLRTAPPVQRQESIDLKKVLTNRLEGCDAKIADIFSQFKKFFPPMNIEAPLSGDSGGHR